ncbi:hypothetical protein N836_16780 [Leptolyngbya sp. Heron Island J]|uniref:DUF4331 domain-containing protein n=1 Tax=Leptolyngbya sp. Heron Island J TaxID=1385935 RepID=UPI0003B9A74B|nr:DUF4331 domain-containing protein [Leptolyngbya sp. Heron Island J]ESA34549.1 hypothetical protein N836_16780 [Leptolyngbya sp. Heron Island J]
MLKSLQTTLGQLSKRQTWLKISGVFLATTLTLGGAATLINASDHDDGEVDIKGRNLNITDVYAFREKDQNPNASEDDLILVMNTNPRSLARQQYYFSTNARYEFHIDTVANKDAKVTGQPDMTLRFEFGTPNNNQEQEVTVTAISNGKARKAQAITTPLLDNSPNVKDVRLGSETLSIFAGLREDAFFFDVEQFFRVRAGAAGIGPAVGFRDPSEAVDFTTGYNVNTIAVRIPKQLLQGRTHSDVFDIWTTISTPDADGNYVQVERLARPGINEGLVLTNDFLNALNSVGPDFEAAALAGQQPAADIAAPIVGEARKTLLALGNSEERADALLGAFLPDVMRIDTSGPSGYANDLNAAGSPVRGRMLKDDVIDITLSVLSNGAITTDNVSYEGTPGNPAQGHQPLEPAFPYLALPN